MGSVWDDDGGSSGIPAPGSPVEEDLLIYRGGAWTRYARGADGSILGYDAAGLASQSAQDWNLVVAPTTPAEEDLLLYRGGVWVGQAKGPDGTLLGYASGLLGPLSASSVRSALSLVVGTDVQAYDAELSALAGLTSAADKAPYFTGSGTAALYTVTTFGRALVGYADAGSVRSALSLVVGTDVQAYDAELSAIAGLTSAADTVPYFTGTGTAALAVLTSHARALLACSAASATCEMLGVIRRQERVWTPIAQAPGLTGGAYGFGATGYSADAANGALIAKFANTPASTFAYGLTATSTRYEYVGVNLFFDATVRFRTGDVAKNRVYVGLLKSTYSGARSGAPVGIYLCFDGVAGDTTWQLVVNDGTTRAAYNTSVTVDSKWIRVRVEVRSAVAYGSIWTSTTDMRMEGVTPVTWSTAPSMPTAQDCGAELYGQPGSSDTVVFDVWEWRTGQPLTLA